MKARNATSGSDLWDNKRAAEAATPTALDLPACANTQGGPVLTIPPQTTDTEPRTRRIRVRVDPRDPHAGMWTCDHCTLFGWSWRYEYAKRDAFRHADRCMLVPR